MPVLGILNNVMKLLAVSNTTTSYYSQNKALTNISHSALFLQPASSVTSILAVPATMWAWLSERYTALAFAVYGIVILYRCVCCHSNKTHALVWKPANSAQLEGTFNPYHSLKLHLGACSSVWMHHWIDTHRQNNRRAWALYVLLGYV